MMQAITPFVLIWLTTSSKECEIINCLQKNNVCHDSSHTRKELLTLMHMVNSIDVIKLDETASSRGLIVMSPTTVQQSSSGPKLSIMLLGGKIKMADHKQLLSNTLDGISKEQWESSVNMWR
jgi:hypothetical protein